MSMITSNRPNFRFLGGEGKRNRANADLFAAMLCVAWGDGCDVIVGHHINFQFDKDLTTEDEVPSADCLLFDHGVMSALFPDDYLSIMQQISVLDRYERENYVRRRFRALYPDKGVADKTTAPPPPAPADHH